MIHRDRDQQSICAVSTPHGHGGISVLRVSGVDSVDVVRKTAPFVPERPDSHRVYYGFLKDPATGEKIDEVLITFFAEGRSFTGQPTIEIACHGSPLICQKILGLLIASGARAASRGEFTFRAFMNNRLDLVQAEAVLALIESRSGEESKMALRQLEGELSKILQKVQDDVTWVLAHLEASIDFSQEGLDVAPARKMKDRLGPALEELKRLEDSFQAGRLLKDGFRVAFAGRPNVGKSSLLNLFLGQERAIVTEIPGTTRDIVEGEVLVGNHRVLFLDTAGLRDSEDPVEKIGIRKSIAAQAEADLVLFVFDVSLGWTAEDEKLWSELKASRIMVLANKADRKAGKFFPPPAIQQKDVLFVSALDKNSRKDVFDRLSSEWLETAGENAVLVSNARHFEKISKARGHVEEVIAQIESGLGAEFLSIGLKEALIDLQEVLGQRFDDQVMDRVFKEFCLGK